MHLFRTAAALLALAALAPIARAQDAPQYVAAPALQGTVWAGGTPTTLAALKGKVVILTFWTNGCINCQRALPFWQKWSKMYLPSDVAIVSVHTPELEAERDIDAVRRYVKEQKLNFPVLIDNDLKNWNAYKVRYWPSTYLIDRQGRIRGLWEGELDWKKSGEWRRVEAGLQLLIREKASSGGTTN
jgi:thiol-disulfide isomerase/thioredoxin